MDIQPITPSMITNFILSCCKLWILCVIVHFPYARLRLFLKLHVVMIVLTQIDALSAYPDYTGSVWLPKFLIQTVRISSLSDVSFWCFVYLLAFGYAVCSACRILVPNAGD